LLTLYRVASFVVLFAFVQLFILKQTEDLAHGFLCGVGLLDILVCGRAGVGWAFAILATFSFR
jgi:hypothetical protein